MGNIAKLVDGGSRKGGEKEKTRTSSLGLSGVWVPNASRISFCKFQNSFSLFFSSETFLCTEMLTIDPVVTPGGRRRDGNSMRWARSPRRICSEMVRLGLRRGMGHAHGHSGILSTQ